jgi:hypothetical protein
MAAEYGQAMVMVLFGSQANEVPDLHAGWDWERWGGGHKLNNIYIFLKRFLELLFWITFSRPCIIIPN